MIRYANNPVPADRLTNKGGRERMAATKKSGARPAAKRNSKPHGAKKNGASTATTNGRKAAAHKTAASSRKHNTAANRAGAKTKKTTKRRPQHNPVSVGGALKFMTAAVTAGLINASINWLMSLLNLQLPQQGIIGLFAKLGVAYGIVVALPRTGFIKQETATLAGLTVAAAAVTNAATPFLEQIAANFLPAAVATPGAQDVYAIPPRTWPNGVGPFPNRMLGGAQTPVAAAVAARRNGMQDVYAIPPKTWGNNYGPYPNFAPAMR